MKNDQNLYRSSDFHIACLLKYSSVPLINIEDSHGKKVWCFKNSIRIDEILDAYCRAGITVNLVDFLAVQRFLKSTIYNN